MGGMLDPFRKILNETAQAIIDNELPEKMSDVINRFVTSVFDVVDDAVEGIRDKTEEKPKEPPPPSP